MLHSSRKLRLLLLRAFYKLYCYPSLPISLLCSVDLLPGKMFNPSHVTQAAHIRARKEGKWGSYVRVLPCIDIQLFDSTAKQSGIKQSPHSPRGHDDPAQHLRPLPTRPSRVQVSTLIHLETRHLRYILSSKGASRPQEKPLSCLPEKVCKAQSMVTRGLCAAKVEEKRSPFLAISRLHI